jgi:DNA-binding NarL/FixJ family response regulator
VGWKNEGGENRMKQIICFIDDSKFEHDLVRNEIASCDPEMEFVQADTFEEVRDILGTKAPGLFLLDLWGKDEDVRAPYITPREELEKKIACFPTLDNVYGGLDDFEGDVINEYLKRLFAMVDSWRTVFEEACNRVGQNRKYGLSNLRQVRKHYPGVPAVFYTRKSMISDAVAMFKAGADGLYIKPTGSNDAETSRLTREYAPELVNALREIILSKTGTN